MLEQIPEIKGDSLSWVLENPEAAARAVSALNSCIAAVNVAERSIKSLSRPNIYSDTAQSSYNQSEITALMAQVESLTKTIRTLIEILVTVIATANR